MIRLPKPRGFWDYALFALVMTGALMFFFLLEASDRVGWADAALAFVAAVLFVFTVILARRAEKAKWIAQPTLYACLLAGLGAFGLMFGAVYADAYLFHRRDITSSRLRHDMVFAVTFTAVMLWSSRRRLPARRQLSSGKVVQKRLWPLCDALKIPRAGFHAFRHMHATILLETGATPKVAQTQLRHADSRVTLDHYAHLIDSSHREAVEKAAAFLDRCGPKIEGSVN
jgi:Phage integrase family